MKINKLGIRTHLKLGLFYGVLASVVQGFAEALILSIKSSDFIFRPQDIFQSQVVFLLSGILDIDREKAIPWISGESLGPNFIDRISLLPTLITVYAVVGFVTGICLGVFLWVAFSFLKKKPRLCEVVYFLSELSVKL